MILKRHLICAAGVFLTVYAGCAAAEIPEKNLPSQNSNSFVDQRALDILKKMSNTITSAKTVSFRVKNVVPTKAPTGVWINLYGDSRVVMQAPDKLFAETRGDFASRDFYYDGKNITMYSPDKNVYAVKPAPATIDEVIEDAYKKEGRSFPYADILVSEPYSVLTDGLERAFYIGRSTLGDTKTEHLAFSNRGVEWQIWIGVENNLPILVSATYLDEIGEPSYMAEFKDWKLNEPVGPGAFTFNNITNASQIEFRSPGEAVSADIKIPESKQREGGYR